MFMFAESFLQKLMCPKKGWTVCYMDMWRQRNRKMNSSEKGKANVQSKNTSETEQILYHKNFSRLCFISVFLHGLKYFCLICNNRQRVWIYNFKRSKLYYIIMSLTEFFASFKKRMTNVCNKHNSLCIENKQYSFSNKNK